MAGAVQQRCLQSVMGSVAQLAATQSLMCRTHTRYMSNVKDSSSTNAGGTGSAQQATGHDSPQYQQQPQSSPRSAQTSQLLQLFAGDQGAGTSYAGPPAATSPSLSARDSQRTAQQQAAPQAFQLQHTRDAVRMVLAAVENCRPLVAVQQVKHGTKVVHIPTIMPEPQQRSIAIRWILEAARKRQLAGPLGKRPKMAECLATELMLAAQKQGAARAKRDEMHRTAYENKANVGYRA